MVLSIVKWLIWASALGFILLVLSAPLFVSGSLGISEIIVTVFVVGLMSVPAWIIHFVQKRKAAPNK